MIDINELSGGDDSAVVLVKPDSLLEKIGGIDVLQAHEGLKVILKDDYSWAREYVAKYLSCDDIGEMRLKVHFRGLHGCGSGSQHEERFVKRGNLWINSGDKYAPEDELFFDNYFGANTEVYSAFEALLNVSSRLSEFINRDK